MRKVHQIQFLSSQQMKEVKEHPWHRLQLEHINPSAHDPYLNVTFILSIESAPVPPHASPPKLATAHLARPLEAHEVAAGVPGLPVRTVQRPSLRAGSVLTTTREQRITWRWKKWKYFHEWIDWPSTLQAASTKSIPITDFMLNEWPILILRLLDFSRHQTQYEMALCRLEAPARWRKLAWYGCQLREGSYPDWYHLITGEGGSRDWCGVVLDSLSSY